MTTEMERVAKLITICGNNKSEFGRRLGMSPQSVSSWLRRGTYDPVALKNGFPEVSSDWLLCGTGPMLESDIDRDEAFALDTLGITREQLESIRSCDSNNVRVYTRDNTDPLQVAEGEPFNLAWFNALLRENAQLKSDLNAIREKNLDLERRCAVAEDRIQNAEQWYRMNFNIKKD